MNDFAGMLTPEEVNLEQKLVSFNDSTSTQIAIVTVPSLEGYDKADYAQQLGEKWGIGQKGLNNGVLILVKPKTSGFKRTGADMQQVMVLKELFPILLVLRLLTVKFFLLSEMEIIMVDWIKPQIH